MKSSLTLGLFLVSLCSTASFVSPKPSSDLGDLLGDLEKKIFSYQALKEKPYRPPFNWYEKEGLFKSDIRVNLYGNPLAQEFRDGALSAVYDNDMFSTGWIVTALLESQLYGKSVSFGGSKVELAVRAIAAYYDHNQKDAKNSLIRTFWPQVFNKTYNIWQQQPINIRNLVFNFDVLPIEEIEKFLKVFGLKKLIELLDDIKNGGYRLIDVFSIPPDYDDTYLNVGLGATLFQLRSQYPSLYQEWANNNTGVQELIDVTVKYSYEPFDTDINKNIIDTRSYFFVRGFVLDAASKNQPVSLITTWVQNIDQQRNLYNKRCSMPFNMNNVDITVGANAIYGITSGAIFNVNGFADAFLANPKMIQTYLNTTKFISWAISTNFTSRPDLAQVYYPSKFNFFWYASRTLFLINNQLAKLSWPADQVQPKFAQNLRRLQDILSEARDYLRDAYEITVTDFLIKDAVIQSAQYSYFRDFLGLNDTDIFGKHVTNNVDALFSTAQAVNILIATWTNQTASGTLKWKPNTPTRAKNLAQTSVNWLQENILDSKLKPMNAFFSGSVKGVDDLPFWYPANFVQFLNGTTVVDPDQLSESDLYIIINGVSGYIDEETFQQQLKKQHYGRDVPIDFHGYNTKGNEFPFWSSEPYTYAVSLLALSQYYNIEQ